MKVVFLGTPQFAVLPLQAILKSKHQVVGVVCQPDRLGSRNKVVFSPIKQFAIDHNLPLFQYDKISKQGVDDLKNLNADIMVTAAYGQMLSQEVLDIAPNGIINIHGSLLPKLRGAAPIQFAIIDGFDITGITILQTVLKMDAGDMILKESLKIHPDETAGQLFERMSQLGAKLIVQALDLIEAKTATFTPQDEQQVTFSKKITPELEQIDFSKPAIDVHNLVRGLNPNPVAWTTLEGKRLKIFKTEVNPNTFDAPCGSVVQVTKTTLTVACGENSAINILQLQPQNGKQMDIKSFLCGNKPQIGTILGEKPTHHC